ncbi:MAG: glucosaminidase domain-containing protein [Candidatus Dormibacteria bacterium]|jgi:hypothetical protein
MAVAAIIAGVVALAVIGATEAPGVQAGSAPAPSSPVTLQSLVAKARGELEALSAQVQTARQQIARDQARSSQERGQLSAVVADEYTGAPDGLLSVLASPDFNSALDTQIALDQLTQTQQQLLIKLAGEIRSEQSTEAQLKQEEQQEETTETRLEAEELVAEFQAEEAASAPTVQGGPAASPSPSSKTSAPASPSPAPTGTPTPTPTGTGTPAPDPSSPAPAPSGNGGPFTVSTNLTLPSGISLGQVQALLQGSPLEADASYFIQAEQANHVSAIYLVADAVLETGWGTSDLYTNKHNLFGFGADDANPYVDGDTFTSDQDCISYVSWFVSVYYLTPPGSQVAGYGGLGGTVETGQFYNGPTVTGMNVDYASDPDWANKIARLGALLQQMG